ncbi:MAG: histidine kinase [Prolixibacteraceae bacterium]|nr:histidine kinase [Prolixibacteraceae bacterium]
MKRKSIIRIALHIIFWFVSLSFFWLIFSRNSGDKINSAIFIALLSPLAIANTYYFNYYLIPRFLIPRKYFRFGWYGTLFAAVALWLSSLTGIFIWFWRAQCDMEAINRNTIDLPMLLAAMFFVVMMGISAKLIRINLQTQNQKERAEKEKVMLDNQLKINELKFLKEQLNPHFLFNTLNNLYGLALEKSDKTPELVMHLSKILDYMLYRTNTPMVPLVQEIEMIDHYVSIEKHRFENLHSINFVVKGEPGDLKIAPLLLLPLVENCFKHGIRKSVKHTSIDIFLYNKKGIFSLETKNSFSDNTREQNGGIGLSNLAKRLEMIYPGAYKLKSEKDENFYYSKLEIDLNGEEEI